MTKLKLQKKSKAKNWMLEHNLSFYFISNALYTPVLICICIWKITHAINEYILTTKAKLLVNQLCSLVLQNAKKRRHMLRISKNLYCCNFCQFEILWKHEKTFLILKKWTKSNHINKFNHDFNALDFMANLYMDCWMSKEVVVIAYSSMLLNFLG